MNAKLTSRRYASPLDLWSGVALLVVAIALPMVFGFNHKVCGIAAQVGIFLILAQGLNVVVGFTGLLDLGYVLFYASGAIFAAFLMSLKRTATGIDWPIGTFDEVTGPPLLGFDGSILLVILAAGLLCALFGVLRGIPTLRVTGDYFAIVTLGIAEIMYETSLWDSSNLVNLSRVTGGAFGIGLEPSHRPTLFGARLYWDAPQFYFLVVACVVLTFVACHHVNQSRVGRAFAAIRLDETAAKSSGVEVSKHKLIAFAFSGFLGGVAGALYAVWADTVAVKSLDVWQSIIILSCVVLGGLGSIRGVAVGTLILVPLGELLRESWKFSDTFTFQVPPEARFLVYGVLLIVFMRFRPQGILPSLRHGVPVDAGERERLLRGDPGLYALDDTETSS